MEPDRIERATCAHRLSLVVPCRKPPVTQRKIVRRDGAAAEIALCVHHAGLHDLMAGC